MKKVFLIIAMLPLLALLVAFAAPSESPVWQDCNVGTIFTDEEVEALAQMLYGEARNCDVEGQAAAVWCVLNRVDDPRFPDTVLEVVTQAGQFFGYRKSNPVLPELVEVVEDVLMRYNVEETGIENPGRVLPREYIYFSGDGYANYFTKTYACTAVWDWSMESPYREAEEWRKN